MKPRFFLKPAIWAAFFLLATAVPANAFEEAVDAPFNEVFRAAEKVLRPAGIREIDPAGRRIETDWEEIEPVARKSRPLFGLGWWSPRKQYERRARYIVEFKTWPTYTQIMVKSRLQYRRADAGMAAPWRALDPRGEARAAEKQVFMDILLEIENTRRAALAVPAA